MYFALFFCYKNEKFSILYRKIKFNHEIIYFFQLIALFSIKAWACDNLEINPFDHCDKISSNSQGDWRIEILEKTELPIVRQGKTKIKRCYSNIFDNCSIHSPSVTKASKPKLTPPPIAKLSALSPPRNWDNGTSFSPLPPPRNK